MSTVDDLLQIRIRLMRGNEIAMGPGKADLLASIEAAGSISGAGRSMGMSYRRAWMLVDTMNRCFRKPLVTPAKGGRKGGGATLTEEGRRVLATYRRVEQAARKAAAKDLSGLIRKMR